MRAFFAVPLSETARSRIGEVLRTLVRADREGRGRPVAEHNLHVTVRFLGDVSAEVASRLGAEVAEALASSAPFPSAARSLQLFPSPRRPRVAALTFDRTEDWRVLASLVEARCRAGGLAPETRPFQAHLTLMRVQGPVRMPGDLDLSGLEIPVSELVLFASQLGPQGPTYTRVRTIPLGH